MLTRRLFLAATGGTLASSAFARVVGEPVPASLDHIFLGVRDLDQGMTYIEERIVYTPKNEDLLRLTGKIGLDLPVNRDGDKTQLRATLTRGKSEFVITS